jgi:hypothetical protein
MIPIRTAPASPGAVVVSKPTTADHLTQRPFPPPKIDPPQTRGNIQPIQKRLADTAAPNAHVSVIRGPVFEADFGGAHEQEDTAERREKKRT